MPKFTAWAKNKNTNQLIYELAPQTRKVKSQTSTIDGLVFIGCTIFTDLPYTKLDNVFTITALPCLVLFYLIGPVDDLGKILKKGNHSGLSPKMKLLAQISVELICTLPLYFSPEFNAEFYLPFYKYSLFNMKIFALAFWILVLVSGSNAVNLADGLDGPATIPSIFSLSTLGVFLYLSKSLSYSEYLLLPKIQGLGEVVIICIALIGALIGSLWCNCYPAQVFMGDNGSLALDGFIDFLATISKNEILLLLIGFVFAPETISVILRVGSSKIFNKRASRMAPIHHHFEKIGWVENKIVIRFRMIALLSSLLALASIKLR